MPSVGDTANVVSEEHMGLLHTLQTDTTHYQIPEPVHIGYTVQNVSPYGIFLQYPQCPCPLGLKVFSPSGSMVWCHPCYCPDLYCEGILPPGDSIEMEPVWDMSGVTTGGTYTIRGNLHVIGPPAFFFLDLPIELMVPSGVPEPGGAIVSTWGKIKARYADPKRHRARAHVRFVR